MEPIRIGIQISVKISQGLMVLRSVTVFPMEILGRVWAIGHEATIILLIMTPDHYTSCASLEFHIALARFVRTANRTVEWYDEFSQPRNKRSPVEIILAWNLR